MILLPFALSLRLTRHLSSSKLGGDRRGRRKKPAGGQNHQSNDRCDRELFIQQFHPTSPFSLLQIINPSFEIYLFPHFFRLAAVFMGGEYRNLYRSLKMTSASR
jgi:hypothetical protein